MGFSALPPAARFEERPEPPIGELRAPHSKCCDWRRHHNDALPVKHLELTVCGYGKTTGGRNIRKGCLACDESADVELWRQIRSQPGLQRSGDRTRGTAFPWWDVSVSKSR